MMTEQTEVPAGATAASVSLRRALSDDARASLEAVRAAQEAAQVRIRRQTVQTRIWFAAATGTVGLLALALSLHMVSRRHAPPRSPAVLAPASMPPPPIAPEPVAPAIGPGPVAAAVAPPAAETAPQPLPVAAEAKPSAVAAAETGCDTRLIRRAPWRLSAQACARAFEADPTNARLALAIAQAEHAHGSATEAAEWAKRTLALDPNAATAYVLIARADMAHGRREEARAAYRRYLELAPRGWHKAEARAATTTAPAGDR
jgi:tetratricopeptide (TPR) repeat protein